MEFANAVDRASAANRQIRHIEWLVGIVRIGPAKRHQILHADAQALDRVPREVELHERGRESVKARRHRSMCREHVAGARGGERDVKGLGVFIHER